MILLLAALAGNDRRRESQSWPVRRGGCCDDVSSDHPQPPGPDHLISRLSAPDVSRPRYYWQFLPVAVRLITLYFCQSPVTSMINVEFYVTQVEK